MKNLDKKEIVNSLSELGVTESDYIFTNIEGRYIPSVLNLPQNHYYIILKKRYSVDKGFYLESVENIKQWIVTNEPRFAIIKDYINDVNVNNANKLVDEINHYILRNYDLVKTLNKSVRVYRENSHSL